jgi:DNA-binding transcriptional ArsR family regulator
MNARRDSKNALDAASSETSYDDAAELLRALAHPVRLRIVDLLEEGELCVKRLEQLLGVSQSSVSQHLSRLRYAGLIESEAWASRVLPLGRDRGGRGPAGGRERDDREGAIGPWRPGRGRRTR